MSDYQMVNHLELTTIRDIDTFKNRGCSHDVRVQAQQAQSRQVPNCHEFSCLFLVPLDILCILVLKVQQFQKEV